MEDSKKYTIAEIGALMLKDQNIHSGRFEVGVGFRVGVGVVGPTSEDRLPGAVVGVQDIGLKPADEDDDGPTIIDAAALNPKKSSRKPAKQ